MKAYCYILYSDSLNRYYVGSTILTIEKRLERHLAGYYGVLKYTHGTNDWNIFLEIECETHTQARRIESHIKKMKSKTYIQNIKKYPELIVKLLNRYYKEEG